MLPAPALVLPAASMVAACLTLHMRPSAAVDAQELAEATGLRAKLQETRQVCCCGVLFCSAEVLSESNHSQPIQRQCCLA